MTLFHSHFERIRRRLEAEGEAAKSFYHSLNKGQIREAFVREFLAQNTSELWGIGTGEIIHKGTLAEGKRSQIDVVIHNKRYPKISLATGIDLFFIETISSFIEIKSFLKKDDLRKVAETTKKIKSQAHFDPQKFNPTGMVKTPRPYSFVFSYKGPNKIETVVKWMKELSEEDDYNLNALKKAKPQDRAFFNNLFIDGVFVLGKGYVLVDSLPEGSPLIEQDQLTSDYIWISGVEKELAILWYLINALNEKSLWNNFDMSSYMGILNFGLG